MTSRALLVLLSIISIVPILLGSLVIFVFRCLRSVVGLLLWLKYGNEAQFLTSNDAMLAVESDTNQMMKDATWIFKGHADILALRKRVGDNIANKKNSDGSWMHPKYRARLCCEFSYFFWLPENNFRIEDHVILYNGIQPKNQSDLLRVYDDFINSSLPKNLARWRIYVIELADNYVGLDPGPHFALLFREHHAISDGVSFIQIITPGIADGMTKFDFMDSQKISEEFSYVGYFKKVLRLLAFGPGICLMNVMTPPDSNCMLYGKKLSGRKIFGISPPIDINRIKRIRNVTGTTINDIVASCICGSLRSYLLRNGGKPQSLHYMIPVSMHDLKKEPIMENQTSFFIYSDATDQPTAIDRLLTTQKKMSDLKNSDAARPAYLMNLMLANILPNFLAEMFQGIFTLTCVFSNLVGPPEFSLHGCKMTRCLFFAAMTGQTGLAVSVVSYRGELIVAVKVDDAYMGKQEIVDRFVEDIIKELEELEKIKNC